MADVFDLIKKSFSLLPSGFYLGPIKVLWE
jgi:hypothetical protein